MAKINKTKNFAINTIFSLLYQVIVFVSGLIVPRIILSVFGSEINGLTSSISQFISYFTLVEAGLSIAAIYALYKPLENDDYDEINTVVKTTHVFYRKSGLVFLLLSIGFSVVYPFFIKVNGLNFSEIVFLVLILAASGIVDFFTLSKYRALLSADQKAYVVSIGNIIYYIVFTVAIVIVAKIWPNIIAVRGFALFSVLFRTIFLKIYCKKRYPFLNFKVKTDKTKLSKRWDALYLQILSSIHNGAPSIIATFTVTLSLVSVYSVYNMVVSGVGGIVGIFTAGLYANFGHFLVSNDEKNTKSVYSQFEVFFHIVNTIVYSLTMMLIIPFVRVYTRGITDVEYIRVFFAILIVTNGFLYNMKTPQGTMIMASGHFKETRVQTTIQGLIAVVGGIIGAVFFGLEGLMVGILLSNLYRIVDVIIYVPKRIIPVGYWKSIKRALISLCLYVFFTIFAFIISKDIYSYFSWFKTAIFYAIMISTIVIVIYSMLEPKETKLIYKRILSIFERRE